MGIMCIFAEKIIDADGAGSTPSIFEVSGVLELDEFWGDSLLGIGCALGTADGATVLDMVALFALGNADEDIVGDIDGDIDGDMDGDIVGDVDEDIGEDMDGDIDEDIGEDADEDIDEDDIEATLSDISCDDGEWIGYRFDLGMIFFSFFLKRRLCAFSVVLFSQ